MTIGIACAVAAALGVNISMLCKHRGAVAAPDVQITRPLRSAVSLFRSRWWAIGFAVAAAHGRCTWWRLRSRRCRWSRR